MLKDFLSKNRDELILRCRAQVAKRSVPRPTEEELQFGIPIFLEQLTRALGSSTPEEMYAVSGSPAPGKEHPASEIDSTATKHGGELHRKGFTVDQVVHDYGDLCQAITKLAAEQEAPITAEEFRTLNLCLDYAIAGAVTEFGKHRDQSISDQETQANNERMGHLAHELRNLLNAAMLSVQAIKRGNVGIAGATGAVLDRSLSRMRNVIDSSLAEVRLTAGSPPRREQFTVGDFVEELQVASALEANNARVSLTVQCVGKELTIESDRQMLASAVANLLQNAFKFTKPNGNVSLRTRATPDRILIEVEDECGGLPEGKAEELFKPFVQKSGNRTGIGLGLSICQRGVEASGGKVKVRNHPGKGCIFTIDLPRQPATQSTSAS